jgi:hypothetical protein
MAQPQGGKTTFGKKQVYEIAFMVVIIAAVWIGGSIMQAANPKTDSAATFGFGQGAVPTAAASNSQPEGSTLVVKDWGLNVPSANFGGKEIKYTSFGNTFKASGMWLILEVKLTNNANATKSLNTWDFELRSKSGKTYQVAGESAPFAIFTGQKSFTDPIAPGASITVPLLFDVTDTANLTLVFMADFGHGEITVVN